MIRDVDGTDSAGLALPVAHHGSEALELGKRLRAIRVEQGLPLSQAASAAGLSRLWAAQIECGEILDLETTHIYARVLGAHLTISLEIDQR